MCTRQTLSRLAAPLGVLAIVGLSTPAAAQHHEGAVPTSGLRAELIADIEQLEQKYLGLADAMTGKYDWRPGEGVRSVSEVLMHVAAANFMFPTMAGVQPPEMYRGANPQETMGKLRVLESETDPARVKETLAHAFRHAKHAVAQVPEDQLEAMTGMFGREVTRRVVLNTMVMHMHEHLGQSIAYARTNGVVPPWSQSSGN